MDQPDEKPFSYRKYFGDAVFKEPRRGLSPKVGIFMVCFGFLVSAGFVLMGVFIGGSMWPAWIGLGAAYLAMVSAEALPKDKVRIAGYLRSGGLILALVACLLSLVSPWFG